MTFCRGRRNCCSDHSHPELGVWHLAPGAGAGRGRGAGAGSPVGSDMIIDKYRYRYVYLGHLLHEAAPALAACAPGVQGEVALTAAGGGGQGGVW